MQSTLLTSGGLLRLKQIIGDKKAFPPIPAIYPVSSATWWGGVRDGRFPKPQKISAQCTAWRSEDIAKLIAEGPAPKAAK